MLQHSEHFDFPEGCFLGDVVFLGFLELLDSDCDEEQSLPFSMVSLFRAL